MGLRGRPSVPAKLKELSGTLRADRVKSGVKFELITKVPKPEVWMSDQGKKNFKRLCQLLISHRLLDVASVPLVVFMAEDWASFQEACRAIKEEGSVMTTSSGYQQASPWIGIRNQAQKNYREVAAMFGLDLLSSQKIGLPGEDTGDEFEKLMREHGEE